MTNEEKVKNFYKKKTLLTLMILFFLATVVLGILYYVIKLSIFFCIGAFVIYIVLSKLYNKKVSK